MSNSNQPYRIACDLDQLIAIRDATELYARIGMGQFDHAIDGTLSSDLGEAEYDRLRSLLAEASRIVRGANRRGIRDQKVAGDRRESWGIYQVVRQFIAFQWQPNGGSTVDFNEPFSSSDRPMVVVSATDESLDRRPAKVRMADELCELVGCPPDDFALALGRIRAWKDAYETREGQP